jgi:anti-sigma factor RsiW
MKPCSKNRKLIAWLALDALDAEKRRRFANHLALCEGCRRYWEEISNVTERLASAAPDSNLEASEVFHHQVAEELQAVESGSVLENLAAWLRGSMLNWRVALPAIAVLVIALLAMVAPRHHPAASLPAPPAGSSCVGIQFRKRPGANHRQLSDGGQSVVGKAVRTADQTGKQESAAGSRLYHFESLSGT